MQVRVSETGQLTIPLTIKEQLGIDAGSWLEVDVIQGSLRATPIHPHHSSSSAPSGLGLAGYHGRRLDIEEMDPLRALEQTDGEHG